MTQVFKCDFCAETNPDPEEMYLHELGCAFNPVNKTCYTCHHYTYRWAMPECVKELDIIKGEDIGNCEGWELGKK